MTENEIIHGIQKSWTFSKAAGVDELFTVPVPLTPADEFVGVALDPAATYEELYLFGLRESQYNILLGDFSYLQFGGRADDELRYAYYPNPFLGAARETISDLSEMRTFVDEGVITFEEFLHAVSEIRRTQHPPLVRYENSAPQYVELRHPCSHLHLGHHSQNRWPVRRILTPGAFTLLILKHFYSEFWSEAAQVAGAQGPISLDDALSLAKTESRLLPDDLFSPREAQHFYLG